VELVAHTVRYFLAAQVSWEKQQSLFSTIPMGLLFRFSHGNPWFHSLLGVPLQLLDDVISRACLYFCKQR